MKKDCSTII
jgi:hypothetical protein